MAIHPILSLLLCVLAGYLMGSVSFAVLLSRGLTGVDVRTQGSGNAGTTNMLRSFGWRQAGLTFFGDFLKGLLAALLGQWLMGPAGLAWLGGYLGGMAALFGHMKPVFFGFRGGKGVATALGVLLAIDPLMLAILLAVGLPLAGISGYVSLASITCGAGAPLVMAALRLWQNTFTWAEFILIVCLATVILYNHRANLKRLRDGTEKKFLTKKTPPDAGADGKGDQHG